MSIRQENSWTINRARDWITSYWKRRRYIEQRRWRQKAHSLNRFAGAAYLWRYYLPRCYVGWKRSIYDRYRIRKIYD